MPVKPRFASLLTEEEAVAEAKRCKLCKDAPCMKGCPISVDIPGFIARIQKGKFQEAAEIIARSNPLPAVCARTCRQERLCEGSCVLDMPIRIGRLEGFASSYLLQQKQKPSRKEGVAVVGSGPAGLAVAEQLAKNGYPVTIHEALERPGGALVSVFPLFRMPEEIIRAKMEDLKALGVSFVCSSLVGSTVGMEELVASHKAVCLTCNAGSPQFLNLPGEHLNHIYHAREFLIRSRLGEKTPVKRGKEAIIIGDDDAALDAARVLARSGARATLISPSTTLSARDEDVQLARKEGVHVMPLTKPLAFLGEGEVSAVRCAQLMTQEEDGEQTLLPIEGTEFSLPCDQAIISSSPVPNPHLARSAKLQRTVGGAIRVDERCRTSLPGVFALPFPDEALSVVHTLREAKKLAGEVEQFLRGK